MTESYVEMKRIKDNIALVTLNRPTKRNALNIELLKHLIEIIEILNADSTIRSIILEGKGPIFCAGLDLAEARDPSTSRESAELIAHAFSAIHLSPHVTIATVHGAAVAGGAGLMLACDIAIAAENTKFGFPETQKGLVAAQVLTFLIRQLGERDIKELLLLGDLIDSNKALAIGLINAVVPPSDLISQAVIMAKKAALGAPHATAETKRLIRKLYPSDFNDDLRVALQIHEEIRASSEAKEGITSFIENRPPAWVKK